MRNMGELGGRIIKAADGEVTSGPYRAIQVLEAVTVTTLTATGVEGTTQIATLPVGTFLFGKGVTVIEISAGVAYLVI